MFCEARDTKLASSKMRCAHGCLCSSACLVLSLCDVQNPCGAFEVRVNMQTAHGLPCRISTPIYMCVSAQTTLFV